MAAFISAQESDRGEHARKVTVGTGENTWAWSSDGWDLTRSGTGFHLDCELSNVKINPAISALIIVDMQNIGLNKALNAPSAPPIKLGLQIIWLNWGLVEEDLTSMPPSEDRMFAFEPKTNKVDYGLGDRLYDPNDPANFLQCGEQPNFTKLPGMELGEITLEDGTSVDAGRTMMRGAWNTALHGPLATAFDEGQKTRRPDVLIHNNRNSGLWKESSDLGVCLKGNAIGTLLFSCVNTDQCVGSTLQDAHAQGYDTIMLKDGCGTDSLPYAKATYEFNCVRAWGFLTSCRALYKAAGLPN